MCTLRPIPMYQLFFPLVTGFELTTFNHLPRPTRSIFTSSCLIFQYGTNLMNWLCNNKLRCYHHTRNWLFFSHCDVKELLFTIVERLRIRLSNVIFLPFMVSSCYYLALIKPGGFTLPYGLVIKLL